MARWPRGEAEIERLLSLKHLQAVTGVAANGRPLLDKAHRTLGTAASIARTDPDSAFVLAYDAARYATTALLTQTGPACHHVRRPRRRQVGHPPTVRRRLPQLRVPALASQRTLSTRAPAPPPPPTSTRRLAQWPDPAASSKRQNSSCRTSATSADLAAHSCPPGTNLPPGMLCICCARLPGTTVALTILPSQSQFRVVSERGLEPPRPIKGTSTSS